MQILQCSSPSASVLNKWLNAFISMCMLAILAMASQETWCLHQIGWMPVHECVFVCVCAHASGCAELIAFPHP